MADEPTVALVADLVSSRSAANRRRLHDRFRDAMDAVNADPDGGVVEALRITVGDELQGRFRTVGDAITATLRLRIDLSPADIRFGIGWGTTQVLDEDGTQDGPAWWTAREAIEWVAAAEKQGPTELVRTAYRNAVPDDGPGEAAVNAALLCRDHLVGSLDERSRRILGGVMDGRTQAQIAEAEGISASAVSQRIKRDGIGLILLAHDELRRVR